MYSNKLRAIALLILAGSAGISACSPVASSDASPQPSALVSNLPPASLQVASLRSPTCGCSLGWVEHMRVNGFQVEDNVVEDIEAVKREHNIPGDLICDRLKMWQIIQ